MNESRCLKSIAEVGATILAYLASSLLAVHAQGVQALVVSVSVGSTTIDDIKLCSVQGQPQVVQALRHERIFQAAMADLWCAGELPMAEKIKRLEVRSPAQKGLAQRLRAEAPEALTFCSDPRSFYVSATSESASDLHQHFA